MFRLPAARPSLRSDPGWNPATDVERATGTLVGIGQGATSAGIWLAIVGLPVGHRDARSVGRHRLARSPVEDRPGAPRTRFRERAPEPRPTGSGGPAVRDPQDPVDVEVLARRAP